MWVKEENPKYDSRKKELFEKYEANFNFEDVYLGVSLPRCWWKLVINDKIFGYAFHFLRKEFNHEIEVVIDEPQQGKGYAKEVIRIMEEDIVKKGGKVIEANIKIINPHLDTIAHILETMQYVLGFPVGWKKKDANQYFSTITYLKKLIME